MFHVKHSFLFLRGYMRTQAGRAWSFAFWSMIIAFSFLIPIDVHAAIVYSQPSAPSDLVISGSGLVDYATTTIPSNLTDSPMYFDFYAKLTGAVTDAQVRIVCNNGPSTTITLQKYVFDGATLALLADGEYHRLQVLASFQTTKADCDYGINSFNFEFGSGSGSWSTKGISVPTAFPYFNVSTTGNDFDNLTVTRIFNVSPVNNSTTSAPVNIAFDYFINSEDATYPFGDEIHDLYDCMQISAVYGTISTGLPFANQYAYCASITSSDGGATWEYGDPPFELDSIGHMEFPLQDASSTYIGDVNIQVTLYNQTDGIATGPKKLLLVDGTEHWFFAIDRFTLPDDSIFASSSFGGLGYSGAAVSAVCNPATTTISTLYINTNFSASQCVSILFTPNGDLINMYVDKFRAGLTTHFPIGYVTDLVTILATTSSSTLTVIDATVPPFIAGTGARINLSLNGVLNPILNATTSRYVNASASSTQTFYQITSYYWNLILYILCAFYIFRRILGKGMIPHFGGKVTTFGNNNYKKL